MPERDQVSRSLLTSQTVIIMLLSVLSIASVISAFWATVALLRVGIKSIFPGMPGYLYLLLWVLWLLFPIATIIYSSNARKHMIGQIESRLALTGQLIGYVSLILIATIVLSEVSLLLSSLGCTSSSPCS
ncbi:MAG TPA: hypothetical protein DHW02_06235 [Ktedonobacter sp.]|nr:hypothetical protein [Ktedonobacter sp.]